MKKFAQRGGEVFRVVALNRVARPWNCYVPAIQQPRRQPLGVLFMEDVAFGAAHDQSRAGHLGEAFGEPTPLGGMRVTDLLEAPPVVLPDPVAVGVLTQIVHQAAAQDLWVAPRVESECAFDD